MDNNRVTNISTRIKLEKPAFQQKRPQLWDARCVDCKWSTGYVRPTDAQMKAHAHRSVHRHEVDLFAEVYVDRLKWRG